MRCFGICNGCRSVFFFLIFLIFLAQIGWADAGKFLNPVTDICWKCIFPIHLAGVNVTPGTKDYADYKKAICTCSGTPPKIGIPLAFWEPLFLIEVVRKPYQSLVLGGISLSSSNVKGHGSISHVGDSGRHSFYQVHYYKFPVLKILDLMPGFSCIDPDPDFAIGYLSELDPLWGDDSWNQVLNPETIVFSTPLAHTACFADCASSNLNLPQDQLFWCAGCNGSSHPMMGHVSHHVGAIQASHLLVYRTLSKLHSLGMMMGAKEDNFCDKKFYPRIKKSLYKTQLVQPIAATKGPCNPLGKSDIFWGSEKSYPYKGEDFVYLVWSKKHCCLDAVETGLPLLWVKP